MPSWRSRTKGPPPAGFDSALNDTFCAFLAQWGEKLSDPGDGDTSQEGAVASDLEERFQSLLKAKQSNFRAPSKKGAILLGGLAAVVIGFIGWQLYGRWERESTEASARAAIADTPGLTGYPFEVRYQDNDALRVAGLTPDEVTLAGLRTRLMDALPATELVYDVQALPKRSVDLDQLATKADLIRSTTDLEVGLITAIDREVEALRTSIRRLETAVPSKDEREINAFRSWLNRQNRAIR